MKAILDEDKIVYFTEREGAVEIGNIPKGVDVGRLRFDGQQVVDLADLTEFYVRQKGPGNFEFHAVQVSNSQFVRMSWNDRKYLINDAGTIRVMTQTEIDARRQKQQEKLDTVQQFKQWLADDEWIGKFAEATPEQISTFIDSNLNNLQSARIIIKRLAIILRYLALKINQE